MYLKTVILKFWRSLSNDYVKKLDNKEIKKIQMFLDYSNDFFHKQI